jgi:hypothetical protein
VKTPARVNGSVSHRLSRNSLSSDVTSFNGTLSTPTRYSQCVEVPSSSFASPQELNNNTERLVRSLLGKRRRSGNTTIYQSNCNMKTELNGDFPFSRSAVKEMSRTPSVSKKNGTLNGTFTSANGISNHPLPNGLPLHNDNAADVIGRVHASKIAMKLIDALVAKGTLPPSTKYIAQQTTANKVAGPREVTFSQEGITSEDEDLDEVSAELLEKQKQLADLEASILPLTENIYERVKAEYALSKFGAQLDCAELEWTKAAEKFTKTLEWTDEERKVCMKARLAHDACAEMYLYGKNDKLAADEAENFPETKKKKDTRRRKRSN